MARLKTIYKDKIIPLMMKEDGYKNPLAVPRLSKIVINMGVGDATVDGKLLDRAVDELTLISGQKAIKRKAKRSEAGFKLRKGMAIGCMVTLRRERMYEFLDRLLNMALPRVRDFRGLSPQSFDGQGNYTLGIKEQIIFSEIDYDKVEKIRGMNITLVTTARSDKEAKRLLELFGFPFVK
ncbi:MAG: 50S ribosomal protein L5 [bacterium]